MRHVEGYVAASVVAACALANAAHPRSFRPCNTAPAAGTAPIEGAQR